ncbi:MAG: sugar transferase [Kiritimatiellae bacterium]|nr:sugar transferase [Kiritimatiellia bacterium]
MDQRAINSRFTAIPPTLTNGVEVNQNSLLQRNAGFQEIEQIQSSTDTLGDSQLYILTKRVADIALAMMLAVVFLPMIVVVMFVLRREAGAIIVGHTRIGKNGKEFKALKFRTMIPDASGAVCELLVRDPQSYELWIRNKNLKNDPRMSTVGKFLRKTSLEQLPKLWNVLKGDMSLVGPRPVTREELRKYGKAAKYYLAFNPGLTGLWQLAGEDNRDYRRQIAIDKQYALSASLGVDLAILFNAIYVVFQRQPHSRVDASEQSLDICSQDAEYTRLSHQD